MSLVTNFFNRPASILSILHVISAGCGNGTAANALSSKLVAPAGWDFVVYGQGLFKAWAVNNNGDTTSTIPFGSMAGATDVTSLVTATRTTSSGDVTLTLNYNNLADKTKFSMASSTGLPSSVTVRIHKF